MDSKEVLRLYMKAFSENLKEIRTVKYKSMDDVAQHSGFDSSNYNKYENGKGNPTIETLLKMASAFGIPPKELFAFDFDISKYKDTYTERLMKIIKAKSRGKLKAVPEMKVVHSKAMDLMAQLKASLGTKTKKAS